MLTLIPFDVCRNIPSIKDYLSEQQNTSVTPKE